MSITPIEESGERSDGEPSGTEQASGVRGLVGAVVSRLERMGRRLLERLRDPFGVAPQRSESRESQLRVSGQRRLVATDDSDSDRQPRALPDGTQVRTEREEDTLRVYEPERGEAYITSDTWETVEQ